MISSCNEKIETITADDLPDMQAMDESKYLPEIQIVEACDCVAPNDITELCSQKTHQQPGSHMGETAGLVVLYKYKDSDQEKIQDIRKESQTTRNKRETFENPPDTANCCSLSSTWN